MKLVTYLIVGLFVLSCSGCSTKDSVDPLVEAACEFGYFSGQQDALKGDIRIRYFDSSWHWTPWNEDTAKKTFEVYFDSELGANKIYKVKIIHKDNTF